MIIKGLFGPNDDDASQKKAELVKFCSICQESMKEDNGDNHCVDCNDKGYNKEASYWKSHFANKKANTLSPALRKIADSLAENKKSLLEGLSPNRHAGYVSDRNIGEIQKNTVAGNKVDFSVIKAQISEILPDILAQLGLKDSVNASLLVDLIVPLKIATPIGNMDYGKAALRTIVCELVAHMNPELITSEGLKPYGKVASLDASSVILNEGFHRVSGAFNNRTRSLSQIAAEADASKEEDSKDEKAEDPDSDKKEQNDYVPEESDSQKAGGVDVANSEKINNAEAEKISDKDAENAMLENKSPLDEDFMHEGSFRRVHQIETGTRSNLSKIVEANQKIAQTNALKFASHVNANQAVESVRLSQKDREVISSRQPLEVLTANFKDGDKLTWNCYKTNRGYLALSSKTAFHARDLQSFLKFAEIDNSFAGWDNIPDAAQDMDQPQDSDAPMVVVLKAPDINTCPCENHADQDAHDNEEELFNLIMELLPQVEEMFPNDDAQTQEDLALTAALDVLEDLRKEATQKKTDLIKQAEDSNLLLNEISKSTNKALAKNPATHDLAESSREYMGVANQSRNGPTPATKATSVKAPANQPAVKHTFPNAKNPSKAELPSVKKEQLKSIKTGPGNAAFDAVAPHVNKALAVASVYVPGDKQKHINQIVAQLYKVKDEDSCINLIASLHKTTPHLTDKQRKALLPTALHDFHDSIISVIASEEVKEEDSKEEKPKNESLDQLMEVTADFSLDDFEMSVEALMELGYSEDVILAVAEQRFTEKEDREAKHIADSEEDEGKSPEKAKQIGYATLNKLKNEKK